ncbi:hypothetical protein UR09_00565 [Candidatus Nitromaritima sp. SCGC AAA799-A02]|nr:hypothetical protein UR09_00565 [Candidatus Nitromaritima sp. SCGC AAA799-A02]
MKLPEVENARIPLEKITGYLLSPTHPNGGSKARFFTRFGFSADEPNILMEALRKHAYNDYAKSEKNPFGIRYVIEAPLPAPDNRKPLIRTVWFIENDEKTPLFVTAYPV